MDIIPSLTTTGSALDAERIRMDVIAQNIANAETTRDEATGKAYQRKIVTFESVLKKASGSATGASGSDGDSNVRPSLKTVKVSGITSDTTPGERIYNPSSPHADKNGFVEMPNVKVAQEMVDLITSSRAYEANLAVAKNSKSMADSALKLGRDQ
jgi:flagellar basal-body rod protein FlgC